MENTMNLEQKQAFQELEQNGCFAVKACESLYDLDNNSNYTRLNVTPEQQMQISVLLQNAPTALASGMLASAYTVEFPKGLPHTLTALKQGGVGSMIKGADGRFVGTASFYEMSTQAAIMGAFSAMSVATGQYFMTQINSELKMINSKMDDILSFLYGDKKAELLAETNFVKYAYENFSSIMMHDVQKVATVGNLQSAKKVAMQDIEFYMGDLDVKVASRTKTFSELEKIVSDCLQIQSSLELSKQLYIMSSLLEMQYAQNTDNTFVAYLENEMTSYIDKCDKRTLTIFSNLKGQIDQYKPKPMEKVDKTSCDQLISGLIEELNNGEEAPVRKAIRKVLHASEKETKYLAKPDGTIYVQN